MLRFKNNPDGTFTKMPLDDEEGTNQDTMKTKEEINHANRKHSVISPSGAKRWMSCTASGMFEHLHGTPSDSVYSTEGTLAHELSEVLLQWELQDMGYKFEKKMSRKALEAKITEIENHEMFHESMYDFCQAYVDYCLEISGILGYDSDAIPLIEQSYDLGFISKGMIGHVDFTVLYPSLGTVYVIDLKYGLGVKVYADQNPQLMLYALGAMTDVAKKYGVTIDNVVVAVAQPRIDNNSWALYSKEEMERFELDVRMQARKNFVPIHEGGTNKMYGITNGGFKAGEHCQFCSAKYKCPELAKQVRTVHEHATDVFNGYKVVKAEEFQELYDMRDNINKFYTAVNAEILASLSRGTPVQGFKLVEGRTTRTITDPENVVKVMKERGYTDSDLYKKSLISMTDIEKILGKKKFNLLLGEYIGITKGTAKAARVNDDRRELSNSAELDFEDIEIFD